MKCVDSRTFKFRFLSQFHTEHCLCVKIVVRTLWNRSLVDFLSGIIHSYAQSSPPNFRFFSCVFGPASTITRCINFRFESLVIKIAEQLTVISIRDFIHVLLNFFFVVNFSKTFQFKLNFNKNVSSMKIKIKSIRSKIIEKNKTISMLKP